MYVGSALDCDRMFGRSRHEVDKNFVLLFQCKTAFLGILEGVAGVFELAFFFTIYNNNRIFVYVSHCYYTYTLINVSITFFYENTACLPLGTYYAAGHTHTHTHKH